MTIDAKYLAFGLNNGAEKIRFTADGNVGIGTTSPGQKLHLRESGATALYIEWDNNSNTKNSYLGLTAGGSFAMQTNDNIRFYTGASYTERMRINSSGNLIIGNTTINGSFGASNSILTVKGSTSGGEGILQITGLGNSATDNVGRVDFHSQSEADPMCSIRAVRGNADDVGNLEFYTNSGGGAASRRLVIENDGAIRAKTGSFVVDTAGQGIYLGGTGSANELDDYEEGNWTPQIYYQNSTDQGNATNTTQTGKYTKIGNLVTLQFRLIWEITGTPATDNIGIKNLPFNGQSLSNNSTYAEVACVLKGFSISGAAGGRGSLTLTTPNNAQYLALFNDSNMVGNMGGVIGAGTHEIRFQLTYMTDQ